MGVIGHYPVLVEAEMKNVPELGFDWGAVTLKRADFDISIKMMVDHHWVDEDENWVVMIDGMPVQLGYDKNTYSTTVMKASVTLDFVRLQFSVHNGIAFIGAGP